MSIYFKGDDYVVKTKTPRRERQSKIPKPPKDYNGSKSIPGTHPVKFNRAKDLKA